MIRSRRRAVPPAGRCSPPRYLPAIRSQLLEAHPSAAILTQSREGNKGPRFTGSHRCGTPSWKRNVTSGIIHGPPTMPLNCPWFGNAVGEPPMPRISVLMPVRDGARWLNEAVASVRRQTFDDFEFV